MARWILGEEPVSIYSRGSCLVDPEIRKLGDIETACVTLVTPSGKQAVILNSRRAAYKEEIVNASEKVKVVVTVEEHSIYGGPGGLVAEILSEASPRRVIRFGIGDRWQLQSDLREQALRSSRRFMTPLLRNWSPR